MTALQNPYLSNQSDNFLIKKNYKIIKQPQKIFQRSYHPKKSPNKQPISCQLSPLKSKNPFNRPSNQPNHIIKQPYHNTTSNTSLNNKLKYQSNVSILSLEKRNHTGKLAQQQYQTKSQQWNMERWRKQFQKEQRDKIRIYGTDVLRYQIIRPNQQYYSMDYINTNYNNIQTNNKYNNKCTINSQSNNKQINNKQTNKHPRQFYQSNPRQKTYQPYQFQNQQDNQVGYTKKLIPNKNRLKASSHYQQQYQVMEHQAPKSYFNKQSQRYNELNYNKLVSLTDEYMLNDHVDANYINDSQKLYQSKQQQMRGQKNNRGPLNFDDIDDLKLRSSIDKQFFNKKSIQSQIHHIPSNDMFSIHRKPTAFFNDHVKSMSIRDPPRFLQYKNQIFFKII